MMIKTIVGALSLTLSTAAFAAEPAPAEAKECCCKKDDEGKMSCCDKHDKAKSAAEHDGHDLESTGHK